MTILSTSDPFSALHTYDSVSLYGERISDNKPSINYPCSVV